MYYLDPVRNFCQIEIQGGHDSADLVVALYPGQTGKLPKPSADGEFNLVWWNVTDHPNPADDPDREIVRVTGISGDSLTITRAQENTTANDHNTPNKRYFMALVLTQKTIEQIDARLNDIIPPQKRIMIAPTGAINGTNKVFATLENYSNLQVFVNGLAQSLADYSQTSSNEITFVDAPMPGDVVNVTYEYMV